MTRLFERTMIKNLDLRNRFVRSATWEGMSDDQGAPTSDLNKLMADLAHGKVGLIITGHAYVSPEGQAAPWQMGAHSEELLPKLALMPQAVHAAGGCIAMQLSHGGVYGVVPGQAIGPSAMANQEGEKCQAMTRNDIRRVVAAFGKAAALAKRAGFDAVQIHAAHGYLLSQFLSPYYNHREDEYGGSVENRGRMVLEVLAEIRQAVGEDFAVMVKINSDDFIEGGLTVSDMLRVAELLQETGIDAIEISGGTIWGPSRHHAVRSGKAALASEAYYREAARLAKARLQVPVMLVGGIRSLNVAEELLAQNEADYISMCRPLIHEPDLIKRWSAGQREPSGCQSENACFGPALSGKGVSCALKQAPVLG
ncbi:NADH:flavin oxidoreductase [Syntrophotalea acetylenica]|uniref:NADH:flavin oxidoreductase n=1 Tax=Syntrophotalea acetylenica TaxID=29542 RepID=A0A1L3GD08_SYNAC|nr:NADH:flavin oxidoreductase [Syntrophotalea acetylenica]APG23729.1 NADH:flavin oxidoreductase [Syntrophotalea acetylenica]APG44306.1 NADH:flavin oxidoreductase [Syntrophotalea acetylenica]